MKGTLDVVSFSPCVRQPDKHEINDAVARKGREDARHELPDLRRVLPRRTRIFIARCLGAWALRKARGAEALLDWAEWIEP